MLKIEHVRTVGFKGFDIDEDVPEKVLYTGKNKSGKTTRAAAIALALYGSIPFSTAGKRTGDILDSFGQESLVVAVKIGGKEFGRKFARNEKGVTQILQYEGKRVAADVFSSMLGKAGSPRIADVSEFMKQSEAKKVDTLFELYPDDTLSTIDSEIENAKADVSIIEKKIAGAESTVVRLTASKSEIVMPSGSISAVKAEIQTVETQILDLQEQIKSAEIEEAKAKAKEESEKLAAKEKEEAAKKAEIEKKTAVSQAIADEKERQKMVVVSESGVTIRQESFLPDDEIPLKTDEDWAKYNIGSMPMSPEMQETINSIQRIIDALVGSGCSTCAALIVAKQELKKYV